jgi:hypothetical protein
MQEYLLLGGAQDYTSFDRVHSAGIECRNSWCRQLLRELESPLLKIRGS